MNWENAWTIGGSTAWYIILTLYIPSVCLHQYVRGKNLIFRFFFYQCTGNLYIGFVVWGLGLCHGVSFLTLLVTLLFLPLSWCGFRNKDALWKKWKQIEDILYELMMKTYGKKVFIRNIKNRLEKRLNAVNEKYLKGHWAELSIFGLVILWIIWFYGWYKLHNTAYGHADEETHLYWISELIHGNIFPAGMYPHGMHTLVAAIAVLSGLTTYRVYITFSILSTVLVFASAYLFFRSCFDNAYVALAGWIFLVLSDIFDVNAYFRFQISFPMEFGLVAAFGMLYSLIQYIQKKEKKDLLLFSLCITWSLMAHFYITILCAVMCVCFGATYLYRLFKKRMVLPLVAAGSIGVFLACVPYALGYVCGYQFERSIEWALGMTSTTAKTAAAEGGEAEKTEDTKAALETASIFEKEAVYLAENFVNQKKTAKILILANKILLLYALLGIIFANNKDKFKRDVFFAVLWEAGAFMACTYYLNLMTLIEVKRMATFLMFLSIPIFCMPFDILLCILKHLKMRVAYVQWIFVLLLAGEMAYLIFSGAGKKKENLFFEIIATEADVKTCLELVEHEKRENWTVISPTNDLSIIRYDGYHYEITDLIKKLEEGKGDIYIPTREIYVVSEKKPISFQNAKRAIDRSDIVAKDNVKELNGQLALKKISWDYGVDSIHSLDAPYYFQRDILMSKLYYWIETVGQIYPGHVSIYYEDEQVCIYKIEQDPYFTINLFVDYKVLAKKEIWG